MKLFICKIFKYLVVLASVIFLILNVRIPHEHWRGLVMDTSYRKLIWDIETIKKSNFDNSIVFVGSSQVEQGIDDNVFKENGLKCYNFGINHGAEDLNYFIIRLIEEKNPQKCTIYINRPKIITFTTQPISGLLYSPNEYLKIFKFKPLLSFFKFLSNRIHIFQKFITNRNRPFNKKPFPNYGLRCHDESGNFTLDQNKIDKQLNSLRLEPYNSFGFIPSPNKIKNVWRSLLFLLSGMSEEMRNTAIKKYESSLTFREIYIPNYEDTFLNDNINLPRFRSSPKSIHVTSLKDLRFLNDKSLWFDRNHLNCQGAKIFSQALINQLKTHSE